MRLTDEEVLFLEEMSSQYFEQEYLQLIQHIEEDYAVNPSYFSQNDKNSRQ